MPRGGARNRSGPAPDPRSGRSEARGFSLAAIPARPIDGRRVPKWPLPERKILVDDFEDGRKVGRIVDEKATAEVAEREREMWAWVWKQPQANAWILPTESFRIPMVAMWVRTFVICERDGATAADKGSLHRLADQIGLTTAGLREMGWKIVDADAATSTPAPAPASATSTGETLPGNVRRLRA